jgi:pimeloyl-ACP methyl ester carboxylesterase
MAGSYISSDDGTPLEAWYIPAQGGESNKLIIFNHALPMCRAGFPGHLGEPWSNYDGVEIDFVIQYKHLIDAGYNVLTYDIRNHGNSSAANNGHLWHRPVGVAGLRGSKEVCRQPPYTRQNEDRALQPVHGRQLAIRSHL